ncbi:UTRA domain-containing protein [Saccharopolyspora spinosa]|uniref:UTRA domain-containing protein n=1 Tax=Saccharopolyspora spinosa TaxID=60894 RepID=UPI001ED95513|nr:UTRA domain-containing protein [Saccharopolyspora spinosa]
MGSGGSSALASKTSISSGIRCSTCWRRPTACRSRRAGRTFSAEPAREDVAEALEVPPGTPVLYLEQVTYTRDRQAVEYSDTRINSTAVKVTSLLTR